MKNVTHLRCGHVIRTLSDPNIEGSEHADRHFLREGKDGSQVAAINKAKKESRSIQAQGGVLRTVETLKGSGCPTAQFKAIN